MSQDQLAGILARYRQSLSAYAQLTRGLSDAAAAPGTPAAVRHRLVEAIEVFLPRLAASLADVLCVAEALDYQTARVHRLRRRAKSAEPLADEEGPQDSATGSMDDAPEDVARLLRQAEEQAALLEESSAALPEDRRAVHDSLAEICRQLAERLRELKD
jgi:hypothetical protein